MSLRRCASFPPTGSPVLSHHFFWSQGIALDGTPFAHEYVTLIESVFFSRSFAGTAVSRELTNGFAPTGFVPGTTKVTKVFQMADSGESTVSGEGS